LTAIKAGILPGCADYLPLIGLYFLNGDLGCFLHTPGAQSKCIVPLNDREAVNSNLL